jgi:hypothetical protein
MPPCNPPSKQRWLCDPLLQDCPDGQKCTPVAFVYNAPWHAFRCALLASDLKGVGEGCRVFGAPNAGCDDCVAGAMCLYVSENDGEGECVPFCDPEDGNSDCPQDQICVTANNGVLLLCLDPCNPLAPACPPGAGCTFVYDMEIFACGPPWTDLGYGEVCTGDLGSCAPGLACVSSAAFPDGVCDETCCTEVCDLSAPNQCPHAANGQICASPYPPGQIPPGHETVGLCRMP